ncbi:MAG: hypothetical protein ABSC55_16940 [Syntrophorhabdales bacterium]|jgi:hypothetical protein
MARGKKAAKGKIVDRDFREGQLAFQNDVPVSDNPYKNYMGRAEAWESGWREAEKSREEGKTNQEKKSILDTAFQWLMGLALAIGLIIGLGIALFGHWFEASEGVMNDTAKAQDKISSALYLVFNEFGRLDVREDHSVRVYISKRAYMQVPYPDRGGAVRTIGKAWCEDKEIGRWRLPKVVLRDIQTGEELGSYGCLTGWVSSK